MVKHQNSVAYFQAKADAAKIKYVRDYWLRRKAGAEALERQLAARAETKAKLKQREDNLNDFSKVAPPETRLDSKHPNGCIISWNKPVGWDPDTYMVFVRDYGQKKWRSVASKNITFETRDMVLTPSILSWGAYKEPYEISIAAVRKGVGYKLSAIHQYPPETTAEIEAAVAPPKPTRLQRIMNAIKTFTGRRTRRGRPYVRDLRDHADMPKITTKERNQAHRNLQETEGSD